MAKTLSFIIQDDAKYTRDLQAFCAFHGYKETILDAEGIEIPNPQNKKNFTEAKLETLFKDQAKNQRRQDAFNNLIIEE
jgi:hypothetical protein